MVAEDIIIKPIITEKSNMDMQDGKYTFKVAKKATKVEIRNAVEKLFNVKVLNVNWWDSAPTGKAAKTGSAKRLPAPPGPTA